MTTEQHLAECPILKPCCDDLAFPEHLQECWATYPSDPPAWCICDALRTCEARVREDERSSNLDWMKESYHRGFDDARWILAKARAAGSAEADQARALLAAMPPDPDVEWHRILLRTALQ